LCRSVERWRGNYQIGRVARSLWKRIGQSVAAFNVGMRGASPGRYSFIKLKDAEDYRRHQFANR
jgi:hypothetical protein